MTYLRGLIDRLGKALGFGSATTRKVSEETAAPRAGVVDENPPEGVT
jgi:hypothetical protein